MVSTNDRKEFTLLPPAGEVLLYVNLSKIEHLYPHESLESLVRGGFTPDLYYLPLPDGRVDIYALLHRGPYDPNVHGVDYLIDEMRQVARVIGESHAVFCPRRDPIVAALV